MGVALGDPSDSGDLGDDYEGKGGEIFGAGDGVLAAEVFAEVVELGLGGGCGLGAEGEKEKKKGGF